MWIRYVVFFWVCRTREHPMLVSVWRCLWHNSPGICSAGCYVLFWGQQKFHNELEGTLNYVVNQSRTTVGGLNNVSSYLSSASAISVEGTGLPTSEKQQIQTLNAQIASAASGLQNKTDSNAQNIHNAINNVYVNFWTPSELHLNN